MKIVLHFLGIIFISMNAAAQWTEPVSGVSDDLNDVHFVTATIGYAVGEGGSLIKSIDAGDTWTVLNSGSTASFQGVHFLDADTGIIVGDNIMLRTTNGGLDWTTISIPFSDILMDIEFTSATTGFCIGYEGALLKTTDAGLNWTIKDSDCNRFLSKLHFPSATVGYATSKGYNSNFIKTVDGGETWFNDTIDANLIYGNLEAVYFIDENTGLIGSWYLSGIVKTADGGANWADVSGTEGPELYSIDFANGAVGFAAGSGGLVMTTTDAGDNWTSETISSSLFAVQALSATELVCVGYLGYIAKKANATSSINEAITAKAIVYPNPSNGQFTISTKSSNEKNCRIYAPDGRLIKAFTLSNQNIDIEIQEGSGIYFLEIINDGRRETLRLVLD
jgi:photosystem II stability/assembly factor-like uncharacterized protein